MPINRRKLLLNKGSVNLNCCSCRRLKLSQVFNPKPKPPQPRYQKHILTKCFHDESVATATPTTTITTTSGTSAVSTATFSPTIDYENECDSNMSRPINGFGKKISGESVAVEKESDDPFLDFKQSMLQMILENNIYSKSDLKELLNCFLQLNSPYHHGIIVRAFTEIWNGVYSVRSSASPRFHYGFRA